MSRASTLLRVDIRIWDGVMNLMALKGYCEAFSIQAMWTLLWYIEIAVPNAFFYDPSGLGKQLDCHAYRFLRIGQDYNAQFLETY